MPVAMQAKLLRVLEEGEVERIGSDKPTKVDVRVVVATHRNLEQLVESRRIPARLVSSRGGVSADAATAARSLRGFAGAGGALCPPGERTERMEACTIQPRRRLRRLKEYAWPGNIRELRNVVERLLLLADGEVNEEDVRTTLPAKRSEGPLHTSTDKAGAGPLAQRVLAFERETVLAELERHGRHVTQTARALGLERSHLYKKCQQLGIDMQNLPERE